MIGLQIVDLLVEQDGPEVLAQEFNHVQVIDEAWTVTGESVSRPARVS